MANVDRSGARRWRLDRAFFTTGLLIAPMLEGKARDARSAAVFAGLLGTAAIAGWLAMGAEGDGNAYLASWHFDLGNFGTIFGLMAGGSGQEQERDPSPSASSGIIREVTPWSRRH